MTEIDYKEMIRQMTDPSYLPTISMPELYENMYSKKSAAYRGFTLFGNISVCRSAESRQELFYATDCLPHQHGNSAVGIPRA